ncbi:Phosphatidylglycerol/phosphatidylinositol transfer protein [Irineochytrium annulatum]|nr:Phosphatidylglycerol/phosphatidylinositol transfer protein [Irineochytrium annulatum]
MIALSFVALLAIAASSAPAAPTTDDASHPGRRLDPIAVNLSLPLLSHQGSTSSPDDNSLILSSVPSSIISCGTPRDIFQPTLLRLVPDPPVRNKPLSVYVKGTLREDVTEGAYADVNVKIGFVTIMDQRMDVCENAPRAGQECPIEAGKKNESHSEDVPRETPPVS